VTARESSLMTRDQRYKAARWAKLFLERDILLSPAWLSLKTAAACQVYGILRHKCQYQRVQGKAAKSRHGAWQHVNNGLMEFRYTEAAKYGIKGGKFVRAIDELVRAGLIDITRSGLGVKKEASLYALSDRWKLFGKPEFVGMARPKRRGPGFGPGNRHGRNCRKKKMSTVTDNSGITVTDNSCDFAGAQK